MQFFLLDISSFGSIATQDNKREKREWEWEREHVFEIQYAGKYCKKCTNITETEKYKNELSFSHIPIQNNLEDPISSDFDMKESIHVCS